MNKQIKTLGIAVVLTALVSCSTYVQLIETESIGKDQVDQNGVCQNDAIKVNYDFWSEDGITYFSVYNKTDKPLYIDWKKSVFIYNDWKNEYWVEKSTTQNFLIPVGTGKNITYERQASTVVSERYTFIPPHTYISVPMTYTIMSDYLSSTTTKKSDSSASYKIFLTQSIRKNGGEKVDIASTTKAGTTKAWEKNFNKNNTIAKFRNFITYASKEDFSDEKYIENEFFINKITEMKTKNFNGKYKNVKITAKIGGSKSKAKVKVYDSPYKNGSKFYNTIIK